MYVSSMKTLKLHAQPPSPAPEHGARYILDISELFTEWMDELMDQPVGNFPLHVMS